MAFKMNKNKAGSIYQKSVYKNSTSFKLRTENEGPTQEDIQKSKAEADKRLSLIGLSTSGETFQGATGEQQVALQQLARKAAQGGGMSEAAINAAKSKILTPTRETGEGL